MKLLLDTVTFLGAAIAPNDISKHARTTSESPKSDLDRTPPACAEGSSLYSRVTLPADLDRVSRGDATTAAAGNAGRDKLDPKRAIAFVVRGGGGVAQRIQAVLWRTGICGGESRQLENHP